jgi:hypothetical protein
MTAAVDVERHLSAFADRHFVRREEVDLVRTRIVRPANRSRHPILHATLVAGPRRTEGNGRQHAEIHRHFRGGVIVTASRAALGQAGEWQDRQCRSGERKRKSCHVFSFARGGLRP